MARPKSLNEEVKGEPFNMRITTKTKYKLELLSRSQLRSKTKVIEYLIDQAFKELNIDFQEIWDIDENERIIKLWEHCPKLLTFEEEVLINDHVR